MTQTATEICSAALLKLGEPVINSLSDGSLNSERCRVRYPKLRDRMLRDHVWAFARNVVILAALEAPSPVAPWTIQLQLPADTARILSLSVDDSELVFERVGQILHTTEAPAVLRYVKDFSTIEEGFGFPNDFAEALASLLAAELCQVVTQNQSLRNTYLEEHYRHLTQARFNGAVELNNHPTTHLSSWLDARAGWSPDQIDPSVRGLSGY